MSSTQDSTYLEDCGDDLPVSNVIREFSFGQFIQLYDPGDAQNPTPTPIVLDDQGSIGRAQAGANGGTPISLLTTFGSETAFDRSQKTKSLEALLDPQSLRPPEYPRLKVDDVAAVIASGSLTQGDTSLTITNLAEVSSALRVGQSVVAWAARPDKEQSVIGVQLDPEISEASLGLDEIYALLATGRIGKEELGGTVDIGTETAADLLNGRPAVLLVKQAESSRLVRVSGPHERPAASSFRFKDIAALIAHPNVPDRLGGKIPLKLDKDSIRTLHSGGTVEVSAGAYAVTVAVEDIQSTRQAQTVAQRTAAEIRRDELGGYRVYEPDSQSGGSVLATLAPQGYQEYPGPVLVAQAAKPDLSDSVQSRLPAKEGVSVAVFVPWTQTWNLEGFSRGALINSLALTPQEEVTIETRSWEYRTRSLEQSSESETEQSFEFNSTAKDSDETVSELTKQHNFNWQIGGSLDVSYQTGVATIQASASATVADALNIVNVAKNSHQQMREQTTKAGAKVRSRRVTRISETVETGREERVTRKLRNTNVTRTLTFDFFETLAKYNVALKFRPERLCLVAFVINPEKRETFTEDFVRQNETSLKNALLEPAVFDGFAGLRMLAAYSAAKQHLSEADKFQKISESATDKNLPADTTGQGASDPPWQPQELAVLALLKQIKSALSTVSASPNMDDALNQIDSAQYHQGDPLSELQRKRGQYWLFIQYCSNKFPQILDGLNALNQKADAALKVEDAQTLASVLPDVNATRNLVNLNDMSNQEKEQAGISSAILSALRRLQRPAWDFGYFSDRMKEESLYTANDSGLGGLCQKLVEALHALDAKRAEGDTRQDKDLAIKEAEKGQEKSSIADKLTMAFPILELANATERASALLAHLDAHPQHYSYALFQGLGPAEQVARLLQASGNRLKVGMFEPRVVAMNGHYLAVPLTPLTTAGLSTFVNTLKQALSTAFADIENTPDTVILPTPGVNVSSRLGPCSTAEESIEAQQRLELERLRAANAKLAVETEILTAEAKRRAQLIAKGDLLPFS